MNILALTAGLFAGAVSASAPALRAGNDAHHVAKNVASTTTVANLGSVTRIDWSTQFLSAMGINACQNVLDVMVAWIQAEGSSCSINPLDVTTSYGDSTNCNSIGVQDFSSVSDSIAATVQTLNIQAYGYPDIVNAMQQCADPMVIANYIAKSSWGTGNLVVECTQDLITYGTYDEWGSKLVVGSR